MYEVYILSFAAGPAGSLP